MDKLTVSKNGIWFKIAKFGGFKEYSYHQNSCTFISKVLIGLFGGSATMIMLVCSLMDVALALIWLGMPDVVDSWLAGSILLRLMGVIGAMSLIFVGMLAVLLVSLSLLAVLDLVYRRIPNFSKRLQPVRDYLSGICKPLNIIERD